MSAAGDLDDRCHLGVLAFGDSITNGGGELQWGVALQSWALWVARGLGLPYTSHAADGARVEHVVSVQIPAFVSTSPNREARFDLGCLYIGVNDVRSLDWDPVTFGRGYRKALDFLAGRCRRTLALTAPVDLGRPRAGAKVGELNAVIRHLAGEYGALVLDLSDFGARNQMMTDHVHPTAFGQIAIAERALALLAGSGFEVRQWPRTLISYEITRWQALRSDLTYAYRHAKVSARALALVWLARALRFRASS